jgi:hypothetical protein
MCLSRRPSPHLPRGEGGEFKKPNVHIQGCLCAHVDHVVLRTLTVRNRCCFLPGSSGLGSLVHPGEDADGGRRRRELRIDPANLYIECRLDVGPHARPRHDRRSRRCVARSCSASDFRNRLVEAFSEGRVSARTLVSAGRGRDTGAPVVALQDALGAADLRSIGRRSDDGGPRPDASGRRPNEVGCRPVRLQRRSTARRHGRPFPTVARGRRNRVGVVHLDPLMCL